MRPFVLFILALVSVLGISSAQSSSNDQAQSVRKIVAEYMKARNDKDTDAVRRLFTPDADQLVSTGEWRKGIDELIRGTSASSHKEAGKSSINVESVRFIDPDVAIVDGRYRTVSLNGKTRDMWTTFVLKRTAGNWRISAIRNMLPAPLH